MLVKLLEREIKRFERLFEQDVSDLGEVPRVPLGDEEGEFDTKELEREIDDRVDAPYRQEFVSRLSEKLGYEVTEGEEGEEVFDIKVKNDVIVMRFVVDEGEPLVVFRTGEQKLTTSLYLILGRKVVSEGEVIETLLEDEKAFQDFVGGVKEVIDQLLGVEQVVEEEPVVSKEEISVEGSEEEGEEEKRTEESRVRRMRRFGRRVAEEEQRRLKLSDFGAEEKKVADTEVKYTQVDVPMEGEVAGSVMKKMMMQDIAKKVSPGEGGYPDIIGWVVEPKEQ